MTTFQSRKAVREEIAGFFVADGSWTKVFDYDPGIKELVKETPVVFIRSAGTEQDFATRDTNKTTYLFEIVSIVLASDGLGDTSIWTPSLAQDKVDDLDRSVRQIIHDNSGTATTANNFIFTGPSGVSPQIFEGGQPYIIETRTLTASLPRGTT